MSKKKNKGKQIAEDFARYFGENKLENWQRLCRDVGIHKELSSITRCREILKTVHVNIFDLLAAVRQGTTPQRFQNSDQLAQYSITNKKIFPKRFAKDNGGPAKVLLRLFF